MNAPDTAQDPAATDTVERDEPSGFSRYAYRIDRVRPALETISITTLCLEHIPALTRALG